MFNILNFNDPQIWVAISFILFFIIFGRFIWKKFSIFLDNKINAISAEIDSASNLHKDAKNLLSEEMKKFQGIEHEINIIIEEGKLKAQNLYNESKEKINDEITKLEKSSLEKILTTFPRQLCSQRCSKKMHGLGLSMQALSCE